MIDRQLCNIDLTFENVFNDGVKVGILPSRTGDLEDVQKSSSGISNDPRRVLVGHEDDAGAEIRRAVDKHVQVADPRSVVELATVVNLSKMRLLVLSIESKVYCILLVRDYSRDVYLTHAGAVDSCSVEN